MQLIKNLVSSVIYEANLQAPLILTAKRSAKIFYEVKLRSSAKRKIGKIFIGPGRACSTVLYRWI